MKKNQDTRRLGKINLSLFTFYCLIAITFLPWFLYLSPSFAKDIYPSDKIAWLIPYKPGGGYDMLARVLNPYLVKYLKEGSPGAKGAQIIIKNETAAGGRKAYSSLYQADPDGYTISGFDSSFATEALVEKLDFDFTQFTYLLRVNKTSRILVTGPRGFSNWDDMQKSARKSELVWGVGAFGRGQHIASIMVKEKFNIPAKFTPFGGTAESMNALMRGDTQVSLVPDESVTGLIKSGDIRVLADFTGQGGYAGIPTSKDLGYPDFGEKLEGHRFMCGPPGLPKDIRNKLIAAFKKSLNDPGFKAMMKKADIPIDAVYGDESEQLAKRVFRYYQQDLKPVLSKYLK